MTKNKYIYIYIIYSYLNIFKSQMRQKRIKKQIQTQIQIQIYIYIDIDIDIDIANRRARCLRWQRGSLQMQARPHGCRGLDVYMYINIYLITSRSGADRKKTNLYIIFGKKHIQGGIWECTNKATTTIIEISIYRTWIGFI